MNYVYGWLAMAAPGGSGSGGGGGNPLGMMMPMLIIFAIFYFMLIRPQQRKEKDRQKMINEVKSGDRVLFSGILGIVSNVKEKTLVVKIADNVKVEVLRGAVTSVLEKGDKLGDEETK